MAVIDTGVCSGIQLQHSNITAGVGVGIQGICLEQNAVLRAAIMVSKVICNCLRI